RNEGTPSSVSEQETIQVQVFPNPSNGKIFLSLPGNETEYRIRIYNITGKYIYDRIVKEKHTTIDLGNEAKGLFLVQVSSGNKMTTKKIIVE
ncbi:MAG TPA: T9SS type A sorting domain-containing protein, partial [Bacteroidia bacterium]